MESEKKVRIELRTEPPVLREWLIGSSRFGYEFNPNELPEGFLKMYFGNKTIIVPIADILTIEMTL